DRLAQHKSKMARDHRSPDEVLNTDMGPAYVFMPDELERPILARNPPYWQRRDLAGAYLGDPFHSTPGTVEIATRWGQRHRTVITEAAPRHLRDWPQYRDSGLWSYVKGHRP
ncbi:MAG: type IV secretory system conjugative DNA transfer family protein, partial [Pseudomonadota bacterium]